MLLKFRNEWQAKLDAKDVSIANLRKHIKSLKGKNVVEKDLPPNKAKDAHIDYIKHSREHADTLREIVENARALSPLDSNLDSACKYVQRIQEVLVYVTDTCPSLTKPSEKLVSVTPLNRNKKVRWKPTGRNFTIDGNACPLTRITSTKVVPLKETTSKLVVQILLWYLDFGCSKHMTGNRSQLINFVQKFIVVALEPVDSTDPPSSTTIDQDASSPSTSQTPQETQSLVIPFCVEEHFHDIKVAHLDNDPFFDILIPEPDSEESSSRDVIPTNVYSINQPPEHLSKWTKDHPLDNNYKEALKEACWIEAMQEELNEFDRLEVWELVPRPDRVMIITLKWIFKVKLDELGGVLKNKARLVARGYRQEEGIEFKESFAPVA
ncbi:retrovirus-related pol polyprotein from transposon TNT 1-94 [Tanacetum coccineum]